MKAVLIVEVPDDYQEYGSGKWYIKGDLLRIGYEEKDGSFIGKKLIEKEMAQLKPLPQARDEHCRYDDWDLECLINAGNRGFNKCLHEILGETE